MLFSNVWSALLSLFSPPSSSLLLLLLPPSSSPPLPSDGLGRTGAFCTLYTVLERVKAEQVVDVFQAVKTIRIQRSGMLETLVHTLTNMGPGLMLLLIRMTRARPISQLVD